MLCLKYKICIQRSDTEVFIATQQLVKTCAMNMHSTVEKLLELVFSNPSVMKLYKENQQDPKPELSNMETLRRVPVVGGCKQAMST